jgi:predicted nucleotide-binding protein
MQQLEDAKRRSNSNPQVAPAQSLRKVFVVHGRDEGAKNEVALFLGKIGLEEIILHQRPNRGRNLLTKFQEEAEGASFAIILMTPDDDGGLAAGPLQKRARQNVVFELGFFIGKLGTPRVAALVLPGLEKPSDFDGICWIEFGRGANWKNELARELKEARVPFDSDAILHA